jgi:rod shape-determining protein MreC
VIKDIGLTVQNVLYTPFRFIGDEINQYSDMKRIYEKYKDIDSNELKSSLLKEENQILKQNLNDLKETLKLQSLMTEYKMVNATVINRNIGNWYNTLTIDRGEKSGLKEEMIVITNGGLIGKIIKTTFLTSDVKLITTTDLNTKISVAIVSNESITYGLLSGYDKNSKELSVIDIVDNSSIKVGDIVKTSGLSDTYPEGIIVGTVSKIESDAFGTSKTIKVIPSSNFSNLRYITVLIGSDSND